MKILTLLTIVAATSGSQAAAQDTMQDLRPDQMLAARQFADIDEDKDSRLTIEEFVTYGDLVFVSMDSDESRSLDESEFLNWGFGMHNLVDEAGTRQDYDVAIRIVFDLWDRDNDGVLRPEEQRDAHRMAFGFADANGNGDLDDEEFSDNFILNVALRTALTATP